jgi:hypothetical protein
MTAEELADHLGELHRQVSLFQPTANEYEAAKKRLVEMAEGNSAEKSVEVAGRDYVVQLGARKNERTITHPIKAFTLLTKRLGKAGAIAAVTIPLGAIDKVATSTEQSAFIVKEQVGSRSVDVVARRPLAA